MFAVHRARTPVPVHAAALTVWVIPTGQPNLQKQHLAMVVRPLMAPLDTAKAEKVAAEVQMAANAKVGAPVQLQLQKVDTDGFIKYLEDEKEWDDGATLNTIKAGGIELVPSFLAEALETLSTVDMSREDAVQSTIEQVPLSVFVDVYDGKKSWVLLLAATASARDDGSGGGSDVFATPYLLQSRQPAATAPSSTALTSIKSQALIVKRGNELNNVLNLKVQSNMYEFMRHDEKTGFPYKPKHPNFCAEGLDVTLGATLHTYYTETGKKPNEATKQEIKRKILKRVSNVERDNRKKPADANIIAAGKAAAAAWQKRHGSTGVFKHDATTTYFLEDVVKLGRYNDDALPFLKRERGDAAADDPTPPPPTSERMPDAAAAAKPAAGERARGDADDVSGAVDVGGGADPPPPTTCARKRARSNIDDKTTKATAATRTRGCTGKHEATKAAAAKPHAVKRVRGGGGKSPSPSPVGQRTRSTRMTTAAAAASVPAKARARADGAPSDKDKEAWARELELLAGAQHDPAAPPPPPPPPPMSPKELPPESLPGTNAEYYL